MRQTFEEGDVFPGVELHLGPGEVRVTWVFLPPGQSPPEY